MSRQGTQCRVAPKAERLPLPAIAFGTIAFGTIMFGTIMFEDTRPPSRLQLINGWARFGATPKAMTAPHRRHRARLAK